LGVGEGAAIVDVAMFDDELVGFEIKSPVDSVRRLRRQALVYGMVLDRCWLVAAERHIEDALAVLPEWWGVLVVPEGEEVTFSLYREALPNPSIDPMGLAALMWREETLQALRDLGQARGLSGANRWRLRGKLCGVLTTGELRSLVRRTVLARIRDGWKKEV
jgi:hypothetical protein